MKKFYFNKIFNILEEDYYKHDSPVIELIEAQTKDPFKILVSTILSARTKDQTTAKVSKKLYNTINNAKDFKKISIEEIQELIYPVGFYKQKAKYLKKLPDVLEKEFDNIIPEEIDSLVKLPGVGRKTANLVRSIAFKKPAICVDIHVHRISNRLGWLKTKKPFDTEMKLRKILPKEFWLKINSYFVSFGQRTCRPRNPKCNECPIAKYCEKIEFKA